MTTNDQHIIFAEQALSKVQDIAKNLESMLQILEQYPGAKRDKLARQTTMLMNELVNHTVGAEVASNMLERTLRYSRISGAAEAEED